MLLAIASTNGVGQCVNSLRRPGSMSSVTAAEKSTTMNAKKGHRRPISGKVRSKYLTTRITLQTCKLFINVITFPRVTGSTVPETKDVTESLTRYATRWAIVADTTFQS